MILHKEPMLVKNYFIIMQINYMIMQIAKNGWFKGILRVTLDEKGP
jgi:hypothetical protein